MEGLTAVDVEEVEDLKAPEELLYGWVGGVGAVNLDVAGLVWGWGGRDTLAARLEGWGGGDVLVEIGNFFECI